MAEKSPAPPVGKTPRFNETATAIVAALVLSLVLSWLIVGSPLRAMRMAYIDYSNTPATGARAASTVDAPLTQQGVTAVQEGKQTSGTQ